MDDYLATEYLKGKSLKDALLDVRDVRIMKISETAPL